MFFNVYFSFKQIHFNIDYINSNGLIKYQYLYKCYIVFPKFLEHNFLLFDKIIKF